MLKEGKQREHSSHMAALVSEAGQLFSTFFTALVLAAACCCWPLAVVVVIVTSARCCIVELPIIIHIHVIQVSKMSQTAPAAAWPG